jgi:hypothetical protein
MERIPDEMILHIFTYLNVMSNQLKPLLEINMSLRKILWINKYTLDHYPHCMGESIACISKSYMEYLNDVRLMEIDANEQCDIIEEIILDNEHEYF